jgi:hypothetical protein
MKNFSFYGFALRTLGLSLAPAFVEFHCAWRPRSNFPHILKCVVVQLKSLFVCKIYKPRMYEKKIRFPSCSVIQAHEHNADTGTLKRGNPIFYSFQVSRCCKQKGVLIDSNTFLIMRHMLTGKIDY